MSALVIAITDWKINAANNKEMKMKRTRMKRRKKKRTGNCMRREGVTKKVESAGGTILSPRLDPDHNENWDQ